jgi:hypothetical protein
MATAIPVVRVAPNRRGVEHAFYGTLIALIVATVFYGFAESYFLAGVVTAPLPNKLIHIHGAVFSSWILFLVLESVLASTGKIAWHRAIGMYGFGIACAMVVLGTMAAMDTLAQHRTPEGFPQLVFFFGSISISLFSFPVLVLAAYLYRRQAQMHKRLIILATLTILPAAVMRWPIDAISRNPFGVSAVIYSFVVLMAAFDLLTLHKIHKATLWGGLFLIVAREAAFPIGATHAWEVVCLWARAHGILSF